MERNPIGWFEIYCGDIERAKTFYEAVLGYSLENLPSPAEDEFKMYAFPGGPDSPGATGALASMPGGEQPSGNGTIVYFSVADCAVEAAKAAENGGSVMKDKFSIGPHGFIALVYDTEGNVIGLHSMQ